MRAILGPQLSAVMERLIPLLVGIFCVMLTLLPWGTSTNFLVPPAFALMAVFHWALYRPDLMPPVSVFLIGVYHDLASGGPIGLWALIYLFTYGVVVSQRLFFIGRPFFAIWLAFGIIAVVSGLIVWTASGLYFGAVLSPVPALVQALVSFVLFPVLGRFFSMIQHRFSSPV